VVKSVMSSRSSSVGFLARSMLLTLRGSMFLIKSAVGAMVASAGSPTCSLGVVWLLSSLSPARSTVLLSSVRAHEASGAVGAMPSRAYARRLVARSISLRLVTKRWTQ
jgi:hypothetical protein